MTKLSNAKKNVKSIQTVEINTVDVVAEQVASTLVKRVALDASDKPVTRIALDASDLRANNHSFAGCMADYSLESSVVDLVGFATSGASDKSGTYIEPVDPMAQYGDLPVKMAYVFDGMELPMNIIIKASDASVEAAKRANDPTGPKVAVKIMCATTDKELFTVVPEKGARKVSVVSGTRHATARTVASTGMSEEQKARIEEERQRKEEERAAKAWDAMVDAAEKDNAKFDQRKEKELKELAIKFAKAQAKLARHPKVDSDAYNNFLLLRREIGATCKELNHEHNVRSGRTDANFGWKQIALDMEKKFTYRLIAMGRQCQVADKKGLSEAMRLIDRDIEIPAGWVDISRF